jgi:glycyl-tRNA synthetase
MNSKVWEASGHVQSFTDPMVDCLQCRGRFRADHIVNNQCPTCGSKNKFTEVRHFNLMFKTHVGALEDSSSVAYLRPETCQGIFANFDNIVNTCRVKVPFGIAQIGKAFRNEINPRNFTFRSREFEQMEMEFFCNPSEAPKWFQYWKDERYNWYLKYGIKKERLHLREHAKDELAHYAAGCADIEYDFPFGCAELEGIANRTDYDLKRHSEFSKKDLSYFDQGLNQRYFPYVIEPSAGADRATLAFLVDAYEEEAERTVLRFHPRIAPIKAAVFPLVNKDGMPETAEQIFNTLKKRWNTFYDDKGAVGRRYRRQDEAGTPFCITVDGETSKDQAVTIRHRDSMAQDRIAMDKVVEYLAKYLEA